MKADASKQTTDPLPNQFKISFNKSGPTIPCMCRTTGYNGFSSAEEEQQLVVSVTTNTAVRTPLKYRYEVSAGKILDEGPVVVWDFSGVVPGRYEIRVNITDAKDPAGVKLSKTVDLIHAPICDCSHFCPEIRIRSNLRSARVGDKVLFRALSFGEDLRDRELRYKWEVSNGQILSGQGTNLIAVRIRAQTSESQTVAAVEVSGLDPAAGCPNLSRLAIQISRNSTRDMSAEGPIAMFLDEDELVYGCPRRDGCPHPSSPDMIVDVFLASMNERDSMFRYSITGGKIVGAGSTVRWDLTNVPPGTYDIEAVQTKKGMIIGVPVKKTITVRSESCICDPVCPYISLSSPGSPVHRGAQFDIAASVSGGSQNIPMIFNWTISEGVIVSGQGSPSISVRVPNKIDKPEVKIELNIGGMNPFAMCAKTLIQEIPITTTTP